ncbi:CAP domain-containing protein [Scheffersomyces coipomensis]|uniref:CAP domain-containing protein n=1 Tax=Scheffersomyces coipomensis TaxID=1788519 RepID=UPI00315C9A75
MKYSSFIPLLCLSSAASAATVYVTNVHYVTVYEGEEVVSPTTSPDLEVAYVTEIIYPDQSTSVQQEQSTSVQQSPAAQAPAVAAQVVNSPANVPTTLVTVATTSTPAPAPAPATTSSSSSNFGTVQDLSFSQEILNDHNEKRADHGVPALSWSQDLYNYAQNYANQYDCSGNLVHSGGPYGENLAVGYSGATPAFTAWYNEGNGYNYAAANVFDHFTQIIWKSSTELGCAYKDCSAENWGKYVICSYNPPGNYIGEGAQNLFN